MSLPHLDSDEELLRYEIGEKEGVLEAITNAFQSLGMDVYESESTINDWTNDSGVTEVDWDSVGACRLTTTVWEHPTAITSDEIRIFE